MKRRNQVKSFALAPAKFWDGPLGFLTLVGFSVVLLIFSAIQPKAVSDIRSMATETISPVFSFVSTPAQNLTMLVGDMTGLSELQARNMLLEEENKRLREWYQTALLLEAENKSLKSMLNVKPDPKRNFITARIVSDSSSTFVKTIVAKAGKNDQIAKNNAVISSQGLVGRVIEANNTTSRILLLTDMNSRIPALIENSNQKTIMSGTNKSYGLLEHLPPETFVEEGARIVTSGDGGIFPPGIPIGRVNGTDGTKPKVALYTDFENLTFVRIASTVQDTTLVKAD